METYTSAHVCADNLRQFGRQRTAQHRHQHVARRQNAFADQVRVDGRDLLLPLEEQPVQRVDAKQVDGLDGLEDDLKRSRQANWDDQSIQKH